MAISVERVNGADAPRIIELEEGQFGDVKSIDISPAGLTKTISAFANTDGGELFIGISEIGRDKNRHWEGFLNQEAANGHLQIFEKLFPLGTDFQYEFLECSEHAGLVLHVQVNKTQGIVRASNDLPYIRRGAQSLPVDTQEALRRLELSKGITTFEDEILNFDLDTITSSEITSEFIRQVIPRAEPSGWLKKQALIRDHKPTVAGILLFADEPQAYLPKHCGIKVYRYRTSASEGSRASMEFTPKTVEGPLYIQIKDAVGLTTDLIEQIPKMGEKKLEAITYPPETLHEIITNAVLHRDYSFADDVHIRIFDNRIEVMSPGKLPAHVTVKNILNERFARNGTIVRILNKFPDPPNQDIGEGLNTAFDAMHKLGLKEPIIKEEENSVLVIIKHEPLASPEEAILDYLERHETIKNKKAREITYISADYRIKSIFGRMVDRGLIEQVPDTRTSATAYRRKKVAAGDGESER